MSSSGLLVGTSAIRFVETPERGFPLLATGLPLTEVEVTKRQHLSYTEARHVWTGAWGVGDC